MGRKPVGKKAMTAAERQRRRRKNLRKEKLKLGLKAEKEKKRQKAAEAYIPTPPGITHWVPVKVRPGEERVILIPRTHPLPSMQWQDLQEEDLSYTAASRSKVKPGKPCGSEKGNEAMSLDARLRAAREAAGLSQLKLALKAGISVDTIVGWEHDRVRPRPDALGKLAAALGVSLEALMTEDVSGATSPRPRKGEVAKPSGKKGKGKRKEK